MSRVLFNCLVRGEPSTKETEPNEKTLKVTERFRFNRKNMVKRDLFQKKIDIMRDKRRKSGSEGIDKNASADKKRRIAQSNLNELAKSYLTNDKADGVEIAFQLKGHPSVKK